MGHGNENALQHPEVQLARSGHIVFGYAASLALMALSLMVVVHHLAGPATMLEIVSGLAFAAIVVQAYFWLRLDFSRTQAWSTVAFLLFIPLFVLTIGLTAWMFAGLYARTMLPGMMH